MRGTILAAICAASASLPTYATAQSGSFAPEIVIAVAGEGERFGVPYIARLADGDYILTWNAGVHSSRLRVDGQRLDSTGRPTGLLHTLVGPTSYLSAVDVAADGAGGFASLFFWAPLNPPGTEFVLSRAFDANLRPRTDSWQEVAEIGGIAQSIAGDLRGDFVAAYYSSRDGRVLARRLHNDGTPVGTEVHVAADDDSRKRWVATAMGGLGEFLVAWRDAQSDFHPGPGIVARRFDVEGNPAGEPFAVSDTGDATTEGFDQRDVVAAMSVDGRLAVTWVRGVGRRGFFDDDCGDVDTTIMRRWFDAAGGALGPAESISGTRCDDSPRIDAAEETVAVVWRAALPICEPASPDCEEGLFEVIQAEPGGNVSADTPLRRSEPDVAMSPDGSFVVVWVEARPDGDVLLTRRYTSAAPAAPECGHATGPGPSSATEVSQYDPAAGKGSDASDVLAATPSSGSPTVSDALAALLTAIGLRPCALCVCDTDDSGVVGASDALRILQFASGMPTPLLCPACG